MGKRRDRRNLTPTVKRACKIASVNTNTPKAVTEEVIYLYYKMIAESINKSDIYDITTFKNFNLPYIGKLFYKERRINSIKNKLDGRKTSNESRR